MRQFLHELIISLGEVRKCASGQSIAVVNRIMNLCALGFTIQCNGYLHLVGI